MNSVVVHGPQACGKTYNAEKLRKFFGLKDIADSWVGDFPLQDTLVLTNDKNTFEAARELFKLNKVVAFEFDEVMRLVNRINDPVNHPKHYTGHPSGIECIEVTRHMGFNLGNAVKYLWRNDLKNGVEDLKKAIWYIEDEIKKREPKK